MNYQKLLLATIGGAIVFFLAGWLIWGFALAGLHEEHTTVYEGFRKAAPSWGLLAVAQIVTALLYAIIYNRWAGIKTFATGAKAGAVIAVLTTLGTDLVNIAFLNWYDWTVVITNIVGAAIWGALGGGAIGWILGRGDD